jgi:hypothetical protein
MALSHRVQNSALYFKREKSRKIKNFLALKNQEICLNGKGKKEGEKDKSES